MGTGIYSAIKTAGVAFTPPPPPPPPPPTGTPRLRLAGMMGRDIAQTKSQLAHIAAGPGGSTVIDVTMARLMDAPYGPLNGPDVAAVDEGLAWAAASRMPVMIRVHYGYRCSAAWKAAVGAVSPWYTNERGDETKPPAPSTVGKGKLWYELPGGMIRFWDAAKLGPLYEDANTKMAARWGSHDWLAAVAIGLGESQYTEICIRQNGVLENRQILGANGYTTANDLAAFAESLAIHKRVWSPLGIMSSASLNTHQGILGPPDYKADNSAARTLAMIVSQVGALGGLALLENNSLMQDDLDYPTMYADMDVRAHAGQPSHYQTRTYDKHVAAWATMGIAPTPVGTVQRAIALGASSVELPVRGTGAGTSASGAPLWVAMTTTQAAELNEQLHANLTL